MGLVDGLGFEEVGQTVTSTETISGTNVYGAGSVTGDKVIAEVMFSGAQAYSTGSLIGDRVVAEVDARVAKSVIQPYVDGEGNIVDNIPAEAGISGGMWVAVSGASGTTPSHVAKPLPTGTGRGAMGICLATVASGTASYPEILTRGFYKGIIAETGMEAHDQIAPGVGAAFNTAAMAGAGSGRGMVTMGGGSEATIAVYLF